MVHLCIPEPTRHHVTGEFVVPQRDPTRRVHAESTEERFPVRERTNALQYERGLTRLVLSEQNCIAVDGQDVVYRVRDGRWRVVEESGGIGVMCGGLPCS